MPMNPQDVVRKEFREAFRGYNQADVDLFLDEVVDEMQRLVEENQRMKVRVTALQQELARYRPGETAQPTDTSEARWRLRRFLEEQGRPLDEIEAMPKSPTVERIAREVPPPPDDGPPVLSQRPDPAAPLPSQRPDAVAPVVETLPRGPGSPETAERIVRISDPMAADPADRAGPAPEQRPERPWERDSKPFWAAE